MDSLLSPIDHCAVRESLTAEKGRRPLRSTLCPLSETETEEAMAALVKDITFTQVERRYADPELKNQKIVLVSYIPSSTARPDEDGIYGMMKVRGVFATEDEANEHSEFLIRNTDSVHAIYHAYVGRPFPITTKTGYENEIKNIDIRKKNIELISQDILNKKRKEKEDMEEMQKREADLLEESKRNAEGKGDDPFDVYITEQVKRAQLLWTYKETKAKFTQMRKSFLASCQRIREFEAEDNTFLERYKERYFQARQQAGLKDENDEESFLKYLGVDMIPEIAEDMTEAEKEIVTVV